MSRFREEVYAKAPKVRAKGHRPAVVGPCKALEDEVRREIRRQYFKKPLQVRKAVHKAQKAQMRLL